MECSDCLLCNLLFLRRKDCIIHGFFIVFAARRDARSFWMFQKTQPSVDWETRSLDGLHIVCFWVDYLCIYVQYTDISYRWTILNNEILKLSSKFKILQISSIPVSLSQNHVADVILKWLIRFVFFFGFPGWWHLLNLSGWWTETHLTQLDDVLSQVLHIFFGGISALKPHRSSKLATVRLPQKCCEMIVLEGDFPPMEHRFFHVGNPSDG